MKISKIFWGGVALAALSFGFVSCSEDDDDPNEMITGSNKNYSIAYTNDSGEVSRGYNTTTFKHLGELVKITINNQTASSYDGVMGFIWDLKQSKSVEGAAVTDSGYQNFFTVGIRNNKGTPQYYISKFFNVTDLQATNFGAHNSSTGKAITVTSHAEGIAKTTPVEIDITNGFLSLGSSFLSKGTLTVYVDIYPIYENSSYGSNIAKHSSDAAGSYVVDFYAEDPTANTSATPIATETIGTNITGYTAKPGQYTLGVYANVYAYQTLNGAWYLAKDYADAEVVEE